MLTIWLDEVTIKHLLSDFKQEIRDCKTVNEPSAYWEELVQILNNNKYGDICITDLAYLQEILDTLGKGYNESVKEYRDFCDDTEKMRDFCTMSKEGFLNMYSYLTEKEYDLTMDKVVNRNK